MMLEELLRTHREEFRRKVVSALAKKYGASEEDVRSRFAEAIERFIQEKYEVVEKVVARLNALSQKRPVLLNIRRDPCSEEVCMICERDRPNVEALKRIYGESISFYEIFDSSPEVALYHIIHQGEGEKLLPMNAIIHKGEVVKFWTGRPVAVEEYQKYLDNILQ